MQQNLTEEAFSNEMDKGNKMKDWIMINSPYPTTIIVLLYLLFVLKLGPSFMQNRTSYQLDGLMRVYNAIQILLNSFLLFYPVFWYPGGISYAIENSCGTLNDSYEDILKWKDTFAVGIWGYLCLKIFDLLDTVFMVLRKKNAHITFLHVYHHTSMVFFSWVTARYTKAHQAVMPGLINLFVHMVMYSYYFLTTFGPQMERYLWWKKHLTKLQLAQFAFVFLYLFLLYLKDCPISRVFMYIWLVNVFVLLCLFVNFYIKAYIKPNSDHQSREVKKDK